MKHYWMLGSVIVVIVMVISVIGYGCRSLLPLMFFNHEGIEIEFNVPTTLKPELSGLYVAEHCQFMTFDTGYWQPQYRLYQVNLVQHSATRYRGMIHFKDNSPCQWHLREFDVSFLYHNQDILNDYHAKAGRGGAILFYLTTALPSFNKQDSAYLQGDVTLTRDYVSHYLPQRESEAEAVVDLFDRRAREADKKLQGVQRLRTYERRLNKYFYDPLLIERNEKTSGQVPRPKITINVTLDESSLFADWAK